MTQTRRRVVVIGAGVGGLAAAARLQAAGNDVTVLEQASAVGGKLGTWTDQGYTFDTGPSLLTLPWTLAETLAATGVALEDVLDLRRLDPIAAYRFADGTWLDAHADDAAFASELDARLTVGAGSQWQALMARAARVWDASAQSVLRAPLDSPMDLLSLARSPRAIHDVAPHRTLRSIGREYLSDPRLRMLLDRYATYSGSDPRRAPAALITVPYAERRFGGWYVEGGLRRIGDVLSERVTALGGTVRTATLVTGIDVVDGTVTGVRSRPSRPRDATHEPNASESNARESNARRIAADLVIANADASTVVDQLLPTRSAPAVRRRVRVAPRSSAGFALLLGIRTADLRDRAARMAHHTVLFPDDYDAEFDGMFGPTPTYVSDPTIYISAPSDPTTAPPGHQAWFVLVNAPRTDQVARPPADYGNHILRRMAARGIDVRYAVTYCVQRTAADLQDATLTPGGAIYGTSSNGPLAAFLRPPNRTGVDGLYLVGGSSHPGGGLPLVLLSAEIVAEAVAAERQ